MRRLPEVVVHLTPLAAYEALLGNTTLDGEAALSIGVESWVLPHFPCCRFGFMRRTGRGRGGV